MNLMSNLHSHRYLQIGMATSQCIQCADMIDPSTLFYIIYTVSLLVDEERKMKLHP